MVCQFHNHCAVQPASDKMRIKLRWIFNSIISVNRLNLISCVTPTQYHNHVTFLRLAMCPRTHKGESPFSAGPNR